MSLITMLRGREILDSRGRPTVEVAITLADGITTFASVPSGASKGTHEARELRDGDTDRYQAQGVRKAVAAVDEMIAPALCGRSPYDQTAIDALLLELDGTQDKHLLGANAMLAVSLAVARAAALSRGVPLYHHFGGADACVLPLPMVNMISGGLHARRNLDFQDFLAIPIGAESYSQALEMVVAVYSSTWTVLDRLGLSTLRADEGGFGPNLPSHAAALEILCEAVDHASFAAGTDVAFAIDVAASHFYEPGDGRYHLPSENIVLTSTELIDMLDGLSRRYPIVALEDALAEDDWDGWLELTARLGSRMLLIGDDLFVTNMERLERGITLGAANSVLVKMNQIGTLTETIAVVERARRAGYETIVSARSGDTEDTALADLAVGTGAGHIKIGSVAQSERLAKYNQLLRIEQELGPRARFAHGGRLRIPSPPVDEVLP